MGPRTTTVGSAADIRIQNAAHAFGRRHVDVACLEKSDCLLVAARMLGSRMAHDAVPRALHERAVPVLVAQSHGAPPL